MRLRFNSFISAKKPWRKEKKKKINTLDPQQFITVFVITDRTLAISIQRNAQIIQLKYKLSLKGYNQEFRLMFAGKELINDFLTLKDYNINGNSTLFMNLRVNGGMFNQDNFTNHQSKKRKFLPDQNFPCTECNKIFRSEDALKDHLDSNIHKNKGNEFSCSQCKKTFHSQESLMDHVKNPNKRHTTAIQQQSQKEEITNLKMQLEEQKREIDELKKTITKLQDGSVLKKRDSDMVVEEYTKQSLIVEPNGLDHLIINNIYYPSSDDTPIMNKYLLKLTIWPKKLSFCSNNLLRTQSKRCTFIRLIQIHECIILNKTGQI